MEPLRGGFAGRCAAETDGGEFRQILCSSNVGAGLGCVNHLHRGRIHTCRGGLDEAGIVGSRHGEFLRGEILGREPLHGESIGEGHTGNGIGEGAGVAGNGCYHGVLSVVLRVAHVEGYGCAFITVVPAAIGEVVVDTGSEHAQ